MILIFPKQDWAAYSRMPPILQSPDQRAMKTEEQKSWTILVQGFKIITALGLGPSL